LKVCVGLNSVASIIPEIKSSFEKQGIATITVSRVESQSVLINNEIDFCIPTWKARCPVFRPGRFYVRFKKWWDKKVESFIWNKVLNECDIFIFIVLSFKDDFSDLEELVKRGKKIFFVFVGDDVRWYYAMKSEFSLYNLHPVEYGIDGIDSIQTLRSRLARIRIAEKYATAIFSRLDQAQLQLRPYYRWNMMVIPENYNVVLNQRKKNPVIIHAPSNRSIKGTKYILDAINRIQNIDKIEITFRLVENIAHSEALLMYESADIVIDQLLLPGTGKLATEALAMGKVVLSNMSYEKYPQKNPAECPVIDVNPDTIYDVLKKIIIDFEFRSSHAALGRKYVETYLDVALFCSKVLDLATGKHIEYDYIPNFFRDCYNSDNSDEVQAINHWTDFIKDTDWYKTFVKPGSRGDFIF